MLCAVRECCLTLPFSYCYTGGSSSSTTSPSYCGAYSFSVQVTGCYDIVLGCDGTSACSGTAAYIISPPPPPSPPNPPDSPYGSGEPPRGVVDTAVFF